MTIEEFLPYDYNELYSLNNFIENQVQKYGDNVLARYQLPDEQDFKIMTYAQAHTIASNLACEWAPLLENVDTIALLADHSVYYLITMHAILKLNVTLMVLSPSNTVAANVNLLNKTKAGFLFVSEKYNELAKTSTQQADHECQIKVLKPFDLDHLAKAQPTTRLHHKATPADIEKTVFIIPSSGTTSLPKPIRLSNRYMFCAVQIYTMELQKKQNINLGASDVILSLLPLFHVFGMWSHLMPMMFGGSFMMYGRLPPSPHDIVTAVESFNASILVTPPVMLTYLAEYMKTTNADALRKVKACISGGAALAQSVGEYLGSNGVKICNVVGSTESGGIATSRVSEQWKHSQSIKLFDPLQPYCDMEPVEGAPDVYHLVLKSSSPSLATGVSNSENGDYATNDLFVKAENDPGYWNFFGRRDDMLAMENGKKTNPVPMEITITEAQIVRRCVVIGEGRQCTAVLIELEMDHAVKYGPEEIITKVQESVDRANQNAPDYSQIFQPMVYILPLDKHLPTTINKGNVIRKEALKQYQKEVDKMYTDFLQGPATTTKDTSELSLDAFLSQAACQILRQTEIDPNKSLFDYGLNSLLAIQLRNRIATRFKNVPTSFLFEYPTLTSMAKGLSSKLPDDMEQRETRYQDTQAILESYVEKAKVDFPAAVHTGVKHDQHTVLLTGATGSLGSFVLRDLILSPQVKKIYCLVRGTNWMERLEKSFQDRLLDTSLLKSKVEALPMKLDESYLGWDEATYTKLKSEVTVIQHCAWLLDFNQPVQHFERECIRGLYNLLKFAYRETDPIHVHFISSVSATAAVQEQTVAEKVSLQDPHVATPMGYAQSKYIVEHLFHFLTQEKNFPCTIERMGQVCGDTQHGVWNTSEQFPLLMIGGSQLGIIPDLQNITVDWLPVDIAATSIVDIMLDEEKSQGFYHIVNPHRVAWSDVLQAMKSCELKFEVVKPEEWVHALSQHQDNPAYRLMSFYEANFKSSGGAKIPVYSVDNTVGVTPRLSQAPSFSSALLQKYLDYWRSVDFYKVQ